MKLTTSAALAIAALIVSGSQTGQTRADLTEYDAVSADGPYSYLPTPGYGAATGGLADAGGADIVTAEEALMTDALLTVLAGSATNPAPNNAPLDAPAVSDTAIVMAGL